MRLPKELAEKFTQLSATWGVRSEALEAEAIRDLLDKYEKKKLSLSGRTAMIVDDSVMMRMVMEEHLARAGVSVTARAENGFEAVKIFNGFDKFDFVLLNVVMPAMDGIEALEDFKKDHGSRIIMVTSSRNPSLVINSVKRGAHQILYRPFGHKDLLDVMSGEAVFSKDMCPVLEERLKPLAEVAQLTQENIRELINYCL